VNGAASFVRVRALERNRKIADRAERSWVGWTWGNSDGNAKREMVCHGWDLGSEGLTLPELTWLQSNLYGKANEAPNRATSSLFRRFGYDSFP